MWSEDVIKKIVNTSSKWVSETGHRGECLKIYIKLVYGK